ncbi:MAG: ABC transporter substrate-binding protein [Eubacteriales bacterium]|nr:ABC transporter substrate-binding protein [Eubacteriales bacterium]
MKKLLAVLLTLMMVLSMSTLAMAEAATEITLWTYPIGGWGNEETVNGIIANFNAVHPEIKVTVQYLDYASGDDQVTTAIEAGTTPDIIMEGPERLVTNWGAAGKMLDVSDLWTEEALADIGATSQAVVAACKTADGKYYEYPLCMTTHCMIIDRAAFEAADAMQYIDEETHTWTTEGFENALRALAAAGNPVTGIVYCGGQGGDQGTRALAMNLYSAKFTNEDHTAYTMNSEAGVKGIQKLADLVTEGVLTADPSIVAGDEIALFCNGTAKMSFCWNASAAASNKTSIAEGIEPFPMAFPSEDGVPELCGGIWGFGLFNNGDDAKAAAAKTFIQFVSDDKTQGPASVYATGFFPVRSSFGDIYAGTEKADNADYAIFMPYLGDYYNVTSGWATQRTEWWNMLQRVFAGGDVTTEVNAYVDASNASITK